MGQLMSTQKQKEAAKIKADWSRRSHTPSEAEITRAALLASEGHLTSVEKMVIEDISLTNIPQDQIKKLTEQVTEEVDIDGINHADQLGSILDCVQSQYLWLGNMELSEAETRALVTAMRDRVKTVELCNVTLDMKELTEYNGQGQCSCLEVWGDNMMIRYDESLREWAADQGWTTTEYDDILLMERNSPTSCIIM